MSDTSGNALPPGWAKTSFGAVTEETVPQNGPQAATSFTYVDIGSVDNTAKRIVEPKRLPAQAAPSRAKQNIEEGDVLVSMTRPNLNAVAMVPQDLEGTVASTGFHVLRAIGVQPSWLYYAVQPNPS